MTFRLPDKLYKLAKDTSEGMKAKLAKLVDPREYGDDDGSGGRRVTPGDTKTNPVRRNRKRTFDIVNHSNITSKVARGPYAGLTRQCSQCGERSAIPGAGSSMSSIMMPIMSDAQHSESEWEFSKRRVCVCGGLWIAV